MELFRTKSLALAGCSAKASTRKKDLSVTEDCIPGHGCQSVLLSTDMNVRAGSSKSRRR